MRDKVRFVAVWGLLGACHFDSVKTMSRNVGEIRKRRFRRAFAIGRRATHGVELTHLPSFEM
jgi:hypothetical protein